MQPQDTTFPDDFAVYFWSHVDRTIDGCWPWQLARDKDGYGLVKYQRRMRRAHRVAWQLANDAPIPSGLWVLHRCNNPPCQNPAHLYVSNAQANADDRERAGHTRRGDAHDSRVHPERRPRGERQWNARLTDAQVLELRAAYARGEGPARVLAARFGIGRSTAQFILSRRSWRHLP